METIDYITANSSSFIFVFIRTASILFTAPIFGAFNVPMKVKAGLSLVIALLISPFYPAALPATTLGFAVAAAGEIVIGAAIGLCARFVFAGIEFAGQVASFQMGLSVASAYDPQHGSQITVIGKMMSILTLLVFLSVNGHLMVILALERSFEVIPPYGFSLTPALMESIVSFSKEVFVLAVKFSAPVVAILVFLNIAMGVMARTVPQLNMFAMGFVLTISIGFIMLLMSIPVFEETSVAVFERMWEGIFGLIGAMRHA